MTKHQKQHDKNIGANQNNQTRSFLSARRTPSGQTAESLAYLVSGAGDGLHLVDALIDTLDIPCLLIHRMLGANLQLVSSCQHYHEVVEMLFPNHQLCEIRLAIHAVRMAHDI